MMTLFYAVAGTVFGFVLSRSGAADYDYIQGMFLFERFQLYGILAAGVLVTAPGLWLLKKRARTVSGAPLTIDRKPFNKGTVAGSLLFGVGWSLTGMCPGPILVNIGEGKVYAVAALAGALVGAALFGATYETLQKPFGLPPLKKPASAAS
ncbi:MAG: YeeE/YedE thiosulfate transporter family protein [Vicinamibacterales bacterium]